MVDLEIQIAKKLQEYPENDLTKDIIIPVLQKSGYHNVEFFGGRSENGKDIVFWDFDRLGRVKLKLAQVKHFKFTNTATGKYSLANIATQITQCFSKPLPYSDKTYHHPNEVFLITTYPVESKTILTRFAEHPQLRDQEITIIDGLELAKLITKHTPEVINKLLGLTPDMISHITPTLNNKILLSALGFHEDKDIRRIHTDIDFSLGRRSTKLFFSSKFKPVKKMLELDNYGLIEFVNILKKLSSLFKLTFLSETLKSLEARLPDENLQKQAKIRIEKLKKSSESQKEHLQKTNKIYTQYKVDLDVIERQAKDNKVDHKSDPEWKRIHQLLTAEWSKVGEAEKHLKETRTELESLSRRSVQLHTLEIFGENLAGQIEEKKSWIEGTVKNFNKKKPSLKELKKFIEDCHEIIALTGEIFDNLRFFNALGLEDIKISRKDFEATRFELSTENLFDTGLNFLILGEAGAGKTTCLQMYVYNRQQLEDKLIFWFPLGAVIQNTGLPGSMKDDQLVEYLIGLLCSYLIDLGISINKDEFYALLKTRKIILLLDGLDEAIKPAPWLPKAVTKMAEVYSANIQFIVTSRTSGDYIKEIPFFGITLLPFTDPQRERFIKQWFENPDDERIVKKIQRHLKSNPAIKDIITNPLLATTLCVLAKHNLPLPRTEVNLYNERIKLFTGHYDNAKKIASRISVPPHTLELLAQKIAYFLHQHNKREEQHSVLLADIAKITQAEIDRGQAVSGLSDLHDPCNLLVPMSDDGKFGFGHLRYQEHLAAQELLQKRSDIKPLLNQSWWRGVLVLFAHMNSNLEWLIREIGDLERCYENEFILRKMIDTRPATEQTNLTHLLDNYILLENDGLTDKRYTLSNNIDDLDDDDYLDLIFGEDLDGKYK